MKILLVAAAVTLAALAVAGCTQSARERSLERWCDSTDRCTRTDGGGRPASTTDYCTGSPHCRAQRN